MCGLIQPHILLLLYAFLNSPDRLPLIARQLLHSAGFGAASVWLLADWPRQA
jgi:hypothetical protein